MTWRKLLSTELVVKQQIFASVSAAVVAIRLKIFRYVSWASNGVIEKLLAPLEAEIMAELAQTASRIDTLTQRSDLSAQESVALKALVLRWQGSHSPARDTIDVGRTDAPMAIMMIGQTDDSFEAFDKGLQSVALAVTNEANTLRTSGRS